MTIMAAVATAPLDASVRTTHTPRTSAYDRLVQRLQDHGSHGHWQAARSLAQCPAHNDGTPSLRITRLTADEARNGKGQALVYCHGGCDLADVLAAIGMSKTDLYDDEPTRSAPRRRLASVRKPSPDELLLREYVHACSTDYREVADAINTGSPVVVTNSPNAAESMREEGIATVYLDEDLFDAVNAPDYPDWACGGHVTLIWDSYFAPIGQVDAVRRWLLEAAVDVEVQAA